MKKIVLIAALLSPFAFHHSPCHAQSVAYDGFDRLQVAYKVPTPELQAEGSRGFALLTLPGYTSGGEIGSPTLPVRSDIIEVPFCSSISVTVENAVYDTIQLSPDDIIYPLQPSRSKSDTARHELVSNGKVYETDAFYGLPLAEVEVMGVARDRRLAQLRFSPVQVNPITGQVVVCRSANVTVTYHNFDADRTREHYQLYHTPAFSVGTTLNSLFSSNYATKQSGSNPIRMVIAVPNVLRCDAIERFANWKRRQGFMTNVVYYQDMGISTNTALASYFTSLYDSASAAYPAPTFIVLVGDHNQLRAFDSRLPDADYWSNDPENDHITDLYFTTWTSGDNLPDCYQGRFSATDTTTLAAIVDKTLLYEQYSFADDSYLSRAALVAGEDNATHTASGWTADNAWVYSDPTMDYIAFNYINADNGYNDVTLYKNDTSYAPTGVTVTGYCSASNASATLRNLYNTGIGWINYSAHGDWNSWTKPSFTVNNANAMTNVGKPSVMIGSCCLSNKFDKSVCLGEALLRRANNAGAVAYIGGTNYTYWVQDFEWAVGARSNIRHNLPPNYDANKLGSYDRLFHTHGESFSAQAITMGAMLYYGNLSVNNSSASTANFKKYYWEIYELMGDPSLMPWLGRASDLGVSAHREGNTLKVSTVPHAYVALVGTSLELIYASYADASGNLSIDLSSVADLSATFLSVSAQKYKPYTRFFASDPVGINGVDASKVTVYPNPATDHVTIDGLPVNSTVELYDAQGRLQFSSKGTEHLTLDTKRYAPGLYLLRIQTSSDIVVRKLMVK